MAPFDPEAEFGDALDFRLVLHGFVALFHRPAVLDETVDWLAEHGYTMITADATPWEAEPDMHRDLAALLDFPDNYGENLDALNDCIGDIAYLEYAATREATGFVLVLRHYDAFAARDRYAAQALLDIFADQARNAAVVGNRMFCLVQSDDPDIMFDPVGAMPVFWNDAEWSKAKRNPGLALGNGQAHAEADE